MHGVYGFVTGPLAWLAFALFIGGLVGKFIYVIRQSRQKDAMIYSYLSLKFSLRSFFMWLLPFAPRNQRLHPVMTIFAFVFHICLFIAPIFLLAHTIMWEEAFGVRIWALPDHAGDVMTVLVIVSLVFFTIRRLTVPEVKFVSLPKDFLVLALVAAPFITGFLAYHQIFDYQVMIILHIVSGELMLALIPFTWLSHMILGPMVRAYLGSEFGGVRHARDW